MTRALLLTLLLAIAGCGPTHSPQFCAELADCHADASCRLDFIHLSYLRECEAEARQ